MCVISAAVCSFSLPVFSCLHTFSFTGCFPVKTLHQSCFSCVCYPQRSHDWSLKTHFPLCRPSVLQLLSCCLGFVLLLSLLFSSDVSSLKFLLLLSCFAVVSGFEVWRINTTKEHMTSGKTLLFSKSNNKRASIVSHRWT